MYKPGGGFNKKGFYKNPKYRTKPKATATQVKKIIDNNKEKMYVQKSLPETNLLTAGASTSAMNISQGDNENERHGTEVKLRSIQLKGYLTVDDECPSDLVRTMIVQDTKYGATEPTITDVIDSVSAIAMGKQDNQFRYKILMDKLTVIKALPNDVVDEYYIPFKYYKKFKKDVIVRFDGADTDPIQNGIYVIQFSKNNNNVASLTTQWNLRARFIEK